MNEPMCPEFERQYHVVYPRVGDSFDDLIFPPLSLLGWQISDEDMTYLIGPFYNMFSLAFNQLPPPSLAPIQ